MFKVFKKSTPCEINKNHIGIEEKIVVPFLI